MTDQTDDREQGPSGESEKVTLTSIFLVFFQVGLLSFGGGIAGWVYRDVVVRKRWISDKTFLTGAALGQILPGANITNLAVYIGQHLRGGAGAAAALLGLLIGPFLGVIALVQAYALIADISWMRAALDGAAAAAIGLLLLVATRTVRHASRGPISILVMLGTFVAVGFLQWPLVPVTICAGLISVAAAWPRGNGGA